MPDRSLILLWTVSTLAVLGIVAVLWQPMIRAWNCVEGASQGERVTARVVGPEEGVGLVLALPQDGEKDETCTVRGRAEDFAKLEADQEVMVFHVLTQPGRCEFVSTVEASQALLRVLLSVTAVLILVIVLITLSAQRSLKEPAKLTSRFDIDRLQRVPGIVACPQCEKAMEEGLVALLNGVHWRRLDQPIGFPNALTGMAGTTPWRGRPRLHAYRCEACEIVLMKHGRSQPDSPRRA